MIRQTKPFVGDQDHTICRSQFRPLCCSGLTLAICFSSIAVGVAFHPVTGMAQQVATDPASTHVFPAGGRRGTVAPIRVGGECLPPHTRFRWNSWELTSPQFLEHRAPSQGEPSLRRKPGELHINYPKEWQSTVAIPQTATSSIYYWWLSCARGGTGARPFIVGELPEFIESESNSDAGNANRVAIPVTLNGQIDGERDLDFYRFAARKGELVIAEVVAARIGSPLETVLTIRDANGRDVDLQEIRIGNDSVLGFKAPHDGEYVLCVANLSVAGGPHLVYRITLTNKPFCRAVFPSGGTGGSEVDLELLTFAGGQQFESLIRPYKLPDETGRHTLSFADILGLASLQCGTGSQHLERELNNTPESACPIDVPAVVHGRIASARDEDWYVMECKKGQALRITSESAGDGLPCLVILSLYDERNAPLIHARAVDSPDRQPDIGHWVVPADGKYFLKVSDTQFGVTGGPEFIYRIRVSESRPDFDVTLKQDWHNHIGGNRSEVEVSVQRRGGYSGPLRILAESLPDGVRTEPLEVAANAISGKLVFVSDPAVVVPGDALVHIQGTAEINGQQITRRAKAFHLGHDAEGVAIGSANTDQLHFTVQAPQAFRLFCNEAYQYAHRGSIHKYLMQVERLNGFSGPITLQIADRQNKDLDGIEVPEVTIPAEETEIMLPIYLPESMHINVQAHSNVYAQGIAKFRDRLSNEQSTCVVSEMRCMIRTLPTVARLRMDRDELELDADRTVNCQLILDRTTLFKGPLELSLVGPPDVSTTPNSIVIPAGEDRVNVQLVFPTTGTSSRRSTVIFRGTGQAEDGAAIVTEARAVVGS